MNYSITTTAVSRLNSLKIGSNRERLPSKLYYNTLSNILQLDGGAFETPRTPIPRCFPGENSVTRVNLRLPNITNLSFLPRQMGKSGPDKKIILRPIINKINRRLGSQEKLTAVLLRGSRALRAAQRSRGGQKALLAQKPFNLNNKGNIGIVNVHCTRNNTVLTLTTRRGRVARGGWASAGSLGFKNSRKSTTYASQAAAKSIALKAKQCGVRALHVALRGTGRAKTAVVRTLNQSAIRILTIRECTPAVHNGCRRPKIRRI